MGWLRNDHQYLAEPLEFRRLRFRDRAEDPRPGVDLHDDHADDYAPVPWWAVDPSFKTCTAPVSLDLAGSCSTDAALTTPHGVGAAITSAAGGPGGTCPPAAHPNFTTPEAA